MEAWDVTLLTPLRKAIPGGPLSLFLHSQLLALTFGLFLIVYLYVCVCMCKCGCTCVEITSAVGPSLPPCLKQCLLFIAGFTMLAGPDALAFSCLCLPLTLRASGLQTDAQDYRQMLLCLAFFSVLAGFYVDLTQATVVGEKGAPVEKMSP